jgi:RNA polymerase sigma factor (sigma-70 family)
MMVPDFDEKRIIAAAIDGDRNSQQQLYSHFYGYAINICLRYAKSRDEAAAILNDGFFKAFRRLDQYDPQRPFRFWLRRILVNAAIDHVRAKHRFQPTESWDEALESGFDEVFEPIIDPDYDVLPILQQVSPAYRTVFNLYIMEEMSHREIAELLGITEAASRSNLARAKTQLRLLWIKEHGTPNGVADKKIAL